MTTTELTATEIANRVRPYVARKHVGDITLDIDPDDFYQDHEYWRVPVHPSREADTLLSYYETLADLEDEIQMEEGIKVVIVPGDPVDSSPFDGAIQNQPSSNQTKESKRQARDKVVKRSPLRHGARVLHKRRVGRLTLQEVADLLRTYIARTKVGDVTIWLDEDHIVQRDGYWDIPVRPSIEPEPLAPYIEALANLEIELRDKENIIIAIASGNPQRL